MQLYTKCTQKHADYLIKHQWVSFTGKQFHSQTAKQAPYVEPECNVHNDDTASPDKDEIEMKRNVVYAENISMKKNVVYGMSNKKPGNKEYYEDVWFCGYGNLWNIFI